MRILVAGGVSRSLVQFRGHLITAMARLGHEVHTCAGDPIDGITHRLAQLGASFHPVTVDRAGTNPARDFAYLRDFTRLVREIRPNLILNYTLKPVVFGSFVARQTGTRVASMITGAGAALPAIRSLRSHLQGAAVRSLLRMSLPANEVVFFQNDDDLREFVNRGLVPARRCYLIPGSGVDLDHYSPVPPPPPPPTFLLVSRMLVQKGIRDFVAAARTLLPHFSARFKLIGPLEHGPRAIAAHELSAWRREGIEYAGEVSDIRPHLAACTVFVLPSYYREGQPRSILEALAMGRAVITTDSPGCRQTVVPGSNGLIVPPRNPEALAQAMRRFIEDPTLHIRMGHASRLLAEQRYCVHSVNRAILQALRILPVDPS